MSTSLKPSRFVPALVAVAIALASIPATPVAAGETVRVGDLVQIIALHKGLPAGSASEAAAALRESGIELPEPLDLDATLDEGTLAAVSSAVGVPVESDQPSAPVTTDQLDSYVTTFGPDLVGGDGGAETRGVPNPGTDKGKGKKKGHFKSPTDPA